MGSQRLVSWSDLLDRINVFPVADGDTGRNMVLSLAPFNNPGQVESSEIIHRLLTSARGNSGNITAFFLSGFLGGSQQSDLRYHADVGRKKAWNAVHDPKPGTMLSVFDAFCEALERFPQSMERDWADRILDILEDTVSSTAERIWIELTCLAQVSAIVCRCQIHVEGLVPVAACELVVGAPPHVYAEGNCRVVPVLGDDGTSELCELVAAEVSPRRVSGGALRPVPSLWEIERSIVTPHRRLFVRVRTITSTDGSVDHLSHRIAPIHDRDRCRCGGRRGRCGCRGCRGCGGAGRRRRPGGRGCRR